MLLNLIFISSQIHVRGKLRLTGLFFLRLDKVGPGNFGLMFCVFFGGCLSGWDDGLGFCLSGLGVGTGNWLPGRNIGNGLCWLFENCKGKLALEALKKLRVNEFFFTKFSPEPSVTLAFVSTRGFYKTHSTINTRRFSAWIYSENKVLIINQEINFKIIASMRKQKLLHSSCF